MNLRVRVLGLELLAITTDDDDGGPGDGEARPMGRVGFAPWQPPDLPALHWWER